MFFHMDFSQLLVEYHSGRIDLAVAGQISDALIVVNNIRASRGVIRFGGKPVRLSDFLIGVYIAAHRCILWSGEGLKMSIEEKLQKITNTFLFDLVTQNDE